jgi:hypothetical protein
MLRAASGRAVSTITKEGSTMRRRIASFLLAAFLAATITILLAPAALAHEARDVGDLEMEVGFGTEPAYAGQPNSVQLLLHHHGEAVTDLGDTLDVEISFGDADPLRLTFEPFFEEGEFGTPGDYRAWFFPTSPGQYTFHLTGTVDGEDVDETFTSGPKTFSDVVSPADVQYPDQVPTTAEIADRIDRESARTADAIDQETTQSERAARAASQAADDASSAMTIGMIGLVVGALGLVVAVIAVARSRPKAA